MDFWNFQARAQTTSIRMYTNIQTKDSPGDIRQTNADPYGSKDQIDSQGIEMWNSSVVRRGPMPPTARTDNWNLHTKICAGIIHLSPMRIWISQTKVQCAGDTLWSICSCNNLQTAQSKFAFSLSPSTYSRKKSKNSIRKCWSCDTAFSKLVVVNFSRVRRGTQWLLSMTIAGWNRSNRTDKDSSSIH